MFYSLQNNFTLKFTLSNVTWMYNKCKKHMLYQHIFVLLYLLPVVMCAFNCVSGGEVKVKRGYKIPLLVSTY